MPSLPPPGFNWQDPVQVAELEQQLGNTCVRGIIPHVDNSYHYMPSLAAGIVFVALFALSMSGHVVQSIWKRTWWSMVFAAGALSKQFLTSATVLYMTFRANELLKRSSWDG